MVKNISTLQKPDLNFKIFKIYPSLDTIPICKQTFSMANYLSSLFTCKPNFFFLASELFNSSHLPEFLHCFATDQNLRLVIVNVAPFACCNPVTITQGDSTVVLPNRKDNMSLLSNSLLAIETRKYTHGVRNT
jgi:hypothetical protein